MASTELLEPLSFGSSAAPAPKVLERFLEIDEETFRVNFDRIPFFIRHCLGDHPLFSLSNLIELSKRLPPENVEYNAGDVPISLDPAKTPRNGLSIEETIRRIEECRSWMVLKFVESDPEYRHLLHACLSEIGDHSEPIAPGMHQREGFIFISSPESVTPYHIDPECNFLLQIRGQKQVSMFDAADRSILSEQELENFYSGAHRNLAFKDEYQQKASVFELRPARGLHFPVTAPHWVKNGNSVSVSFSITFRTRASERRSIIHTINSALRGHGLTPTPFGHSSFRDGAKYHTFRALRGTKRLVVGRKSKEAGHS